MKIILQEDEKGRYYEIMNKGRQKTFVITTVVSIDMTEADLFRRKVEKENNVRITFTSLIIKASANALEDFPFICGCWDGDDIVRCPNPGEITISGSVKVENTLGSFIIEGASQKGLLEISKELDSQIHEARSKDKGMEFPPLPFFLITNPGTLGPLESADMFGFVPETVATMALSTILEKPAVKDGQIQIRRMMNSILFSNHRAMNADIPIEFQTQLKRDLEEPFTYLI